MKDELHGFGVLLNPIHSRPGYPRIHICLDRWGLVGNDSSCTIPLLSLDLESEQEVDEAVDELIRDLENVRRSAKSTLRRKKKAAA